MKITWTIEPKDVEAVRSIVDAGRDNPMVRHRLKHNLADKKFSVSHETFWQALVASLLTTQQRSGPGSPVARFVNAKPFPLPYIESREQRGQKAHFSKMLTGFGGIRWHDKISDHLVENLRRLENGLWSEVDMNIKRLRQPVTREIEIEVADFVDEELIGFGPKQARNLLQGLGLTRYEIPIDSRLMKWLNGTGFPVKLSATALADKNYYRFVMDGIVHLCEAADVYPCVFDAAVFAFPDGDGWTNENVGWLR